MSSDRELLELAAKAVGLHVIEEAQRRRDKLGCGHLGLWVSGNTCWNPLTEDGDALRLAVKLHLEIDHNHPLDNEEWVMAIRNGQMTGVTEEVDGDRYAATRRAIVMAAAGIGRALP